MKTASPAKLRLMLLDRSVELARMVAKQWRENPEGAGPNEQSLTLLDFLSELLSGVTSDETDVCNQVADLYVFLTQHLVMAEEHGDAGAIDEIRLVLETEAETWRMVVANEAPVSVKQQFADASSTAAETTGQRKSSGLSFQA